LSIASAIRPRITRVRAGAALLGPAFVAAIAYVDPGNVATNTAAGAQFGYLLVWVVVAANVMAGLVQYLSAKLGLVTGLSLPEAVRDTLSTPARLGYWAQAEVVAMATDLAEVLGGAIALNLLFDLPLPLGGLITGVVSTGLLLVQDRAGQRPFERVITGLLLVIAIGFAAGLFVEPPSGSGIVGGLVPQFAGSESVLLAAGMLGATVMPHAVYLHSALARDRHGQRTGRPLGKLLTATRFDVGIAMVFAGAVNLAMLLLAASALTGMDGIDTLPGVHTAIGEHLGSGIALLFAIGLLASGFASTSVGCYAGAVVMGGLLRRRIPLLARRLLTLVPALVLLAFNVDPSWALVISQVVLSFGIPFALIPLVKLTAKRSLMGDNTNHRVTTGLAWLIAAAVIALNLALIYLTVTGS
jgi:manganese transport protein